MEYKIEKKDGWYNIYEFDPDLNCYLLIELTLTLIRAHWFLKRYIKRKPAEVIGYYDEQGNKIK